MAIPSKVPMTISGKKKLENELKTLTQKERPLIIKAIEEARSHGDLSENAEYSAAKERQSLIEGRINEIQTKLNTAEVIDTSKIQSNKIVFGAFVEMMDLETEKVHKYQIVGTDEADVGQSTISILSPLARALIGKKEGDEVLVSTVKGEKGYQILSFSFK